MSALHERIYEIVWEDGAWAVLTEPWLDYHQEEWPLGQVVVATFPKLYEAEQAVINWRRRQDALLS